MTDHARIAYDALAPRYDEFTANNNYELWFSVLLPKLEAHGLRHGSLLDVGCGTGKAIAPMLGRGWRIRSVDISAAMVAEAVRKHGDDEVEFDVCSMTELPVYGEFQLVWALNDPVNYLLGEDELAAGLRAMGSNLAEDGLLVFDTNTRRGMDSLFGVEETDGGWNWRGLGGDATDIYAAQLAGDGVPEHRHEERFWSVPEIQAALVDAGLTPIAAMGQRETPTTVAIEGDWDESRDHKIIHVASR